MIVATHEPDYHAMNRMTKMKWTCCVCHTAFFPREYEVKKHMLTVPDTNGMMGAVCLGCLNQISTGADELEVKHLMERMRVERGMMALEGEE